MAQRTFLVAALVASTSSVTTAPIATALGRITCHSAAIGTHILHYRAALVLPARDLVRSRLDDLLNILPVLLCLTLLRLVVSSPPFAHPLLVSYNNCPAFYARPLRPSPIP